LRTERRRSSCRHAQFSGWRLLWLGSCPAAWC